MKAAVMSEGKSIRSLCTSQGPLSAITQNNRDSMVLADCAKHCSSLTPEEAERLSRIKTRKPLPAPFCSSLLSLPRKSARKWGGWRDYVWLIWGQLPVSPEHQMREEEGMSKRCECQCLLEGWEGDGGRGLKLLLTGSQLEHDRHNLPHMRSAWLVAGGSRVGVLGLWRCLRSPLWKPAVAAVVTVCQN